jgi:hypothetical protein
MRMIGDRNPEGSEEGVSSIKANFEEDAAEAAFLSAISKIPSTFNPLNDSEKLLLDNWSNGLLTENDSKIARGLVNSNIAARDYILETRLQNAANNSPAPPTALSNKILSTSRSSNPSKFNFISKAFSNGSWRMSIIAGAATLAASLLVFINKPQTINDEPQQSFQIAMADLSDRNSLYESSDFITRGTKKTSTEKKSSGDISIPVALINNLSTNIIDGPNTTNKQLAELDIKERLKDIIGSDILRRATVFIDRQLIDAASKTSDEMIAARVFDLQKAANSSLRKQLLLNDQRWAILLALKP